MTIIKAFLFSGGEAMLKSAGKHYSDT